MITLDIVYIGIAFILLPLFFVKTLKNPWLLHRFKERLGIIKRRQEATILIHAASVGEVASAGALVKKLKESLPFERFVITTITYLGRRNAERFLHPDNLFYAPLDISWIIKNFLRRIRPRILILIEQELWPNLILHAKRLRIPVVVVNAKITKKALKNYLLAGNLFKNVVSMIDFILVQNEDYKNHFLRLGIKPSKVKITGNLKYDTTPQIDLLKEAQRYKRILNIKGGPVIVAGSTHAPEEEILIEIFLELSRNHPRARLIIAPRHLERVPDILNLIESKGLRCYKLSQIFSQGINQEAVILVDVIGELFKIYTVADLVFVGGTFAPRGGQNIIEPASLGKPILVGPSLFNFKDVVNELEKNNAILIAKTPIIIKERILSLIESPEIMNRMGQNAERVVNKNKGALSLAIDYILPFLRGLV